MIRHRAAVWVVTVAAVSAGCEGLGNRSAAPPMTTASSSAAAAEPVAAADSAPTLTVSGGRLAIDGRRRFLVGISLFDALGPTPPRDEDLAALERWGIGIVRVWAHWHDAVYGSDGAITRDGRERIARLLPRLRAHGLMLELVLLRPGQMPGQAAAVFSSAEARLRAVGELTGLLRRDRDVLFDLYNEHNHRGGPITHGDARAIRDIVKKIDPDRVVTLSSTEYHFFDGRGRISESGRNNLREEVESVGVDVVAVHLPRTFDWAERTGPRVTELLEALSHVAHAVPVYLNEPKRAASPNLVLPAGSYLEALSGARSAGAAGWIFHTSAGYGLDKAALLETLTAEERRALDAISRSIRN